MVDSLHDPCHYPSFFERQVMREVAYWGEHAAVKTIGVSTLDQERENILKAIGFGLAVAPTLSATLWPATRHLIVTFAPYMERRGLWDAWHTLLERAIATARPMADVAGEITLTALLARLSQRQSRGADVVAYYRRVIRLARRTDNRFELARACSNLGYHYCETGQWWRAEILGQYALALFAALDSPHGQAHTHNHLGLLYLQLYSWAESENHFLQACILWRALGDLHSLACYGLLNLSWLYNETNRFSEAIVCCKEGLHQLQRTGEVIQGNVLLNNLGIAYLLLGDLEQAEVYLAQAAQGYRVYPNLLGLAHLWHNLGRLALRCGRLNEAEQLFIRAYQSYTDLYKADNQRQVLLSLINYSLTCENVSQARLYIDELEKQIAYQSNVNIKKYWLLRIDECRNKVAFLNNNK